MFPSGNVVNRLDYVIFNVLACNTDAHAKNYSLMISGKGFKLAPIYDVMCAGARDAQHGAEDRRQDPR